MSGFCPYRGIWPYVDKTIVVIGLVCMTLQPALRSSAELDRFIQEKVLLPVSLASVLSPYGSSAIASALSRVLHTRKRHSFGVSIFVCDRKGWLRSSHSVRIRSGRKRLMQRSTRLMLSFSSTTPSAKNLCWSMLLARRYLWIRSILRAA